MGTRLYPLPGRDGHGTKVWYPLGWGIGMGINFFYGDGYGIAKSVPAPPRCHPYTWCLAVRMVPPGDNCQTGTSRMRGAWRRVVPTKRFRAIFRLVTLAWCQTIPRAVTSWVGRFLHYFGRRSWGDDLLGAHLWVVACNGKLNMWPF